MEYKYRFVSLAKYYSKHFISDILYILAYYTYYVYLTIF